VAVAGRKLAAVAGDGRAFGDLGRTGSGQRRDAGDDGRAIARVASTGTAAALPEPSQSATAETASAGTGADSDTGRDEAAEDRADVQLHIDPTPMQVAVFLGVFLLGLAAAVVASSTRSPGAHRRH